MTLFDDIKEVSLNTGDFTLSSGLRSNKYWDKYAFETNASLLNRVTTELFKLQGSRDYDLLAGIAVGGVPLVTALALHANKPFLIIREPKGYGISKQIEGRFKPGQKVMLVEDIVTTGKQANEAVSTLRKAGLTITRVLCVIDRLCGGRELLAKNDCELRALFMSEE